MPSVAFFASVRQSLFAGAMQQSAIDAINALEAAWIAAGVHSSDQLAYVFATVLNETGATMKPVEESLNYSAERAQKVWPNKFPTVAAAAPYAHNPQKLGNHVYAGIIGNGNEASGDGYRFRGRGFSQLTGRANYTKFGTLIGIDLIANPDKLLDPAIGAKVLVTGMIGGLFTGKKLSDYFTATKRDATHARAIVNGDVAANGPKIAGYWGRFVAALGVPTMTITPVPPAPAPSPIKSPAPVSTPIPQPSFLETAKMNLSLFSLLLNLLPVIPMLEQDFELEVKNLASSEDGKTKAIQTLHLLEDASKKLRAALGDSAP